MQEATKILEQELEWLKQPFWQNKELMRRNIRLSTKMKILTCYVFSVLDYGCETWTWNSPMRQKVNAFEMWCYRMILFISWRDKVSNKKVMIRVQTELQTEMHFTKDMIKRKLEYAGHVLRGSSGLSHLQILEGKVEGKKKVGCPIRIWMNDICDWSLLGTYGKVKRAAEDRKRWKLGRVSISFYPQQLFSPYHKYLKVTSHIYHSSIFLLDNPLSFFSSTLSSRICRCDKPLEPLSTCPTYSNFLFTISFVKCNSVCNSVCI